MLCLCVMKSWYMYFAAVGDEKSDAGLPKCQVWKRLGQKTLHPDQQDQRGLVVKTIQCLCNKHALKFWNFASVGKSEMLPWIWVTDHWYEVWEFSVLKKVKLRPVMKTAVLVVDNGHSWLSFQTAILADELRKRLAHFNIHVPRDSNRTLTSEDELVLKVCEQSCCHCLWKDLVCTVLYLQQFVEPTKSAVTFFCSWWWLEHSTPTTLFRVRWTKTWLRGSCAARTTQQQLWWVQNGLSNTHHFVISFTLPEMKLIEWLELLR